MDYPKGAGAAAYNEESGRMTSFSVLFQNIFAHICPQWIKGNAKGGSLPCLCSETDILGENYSWQIPVNHNDFKIFKNNESLLCEVLQNKFGCISTLVSPAKESKSDSLQVFRKMLTPGLELSVWKDNLTRHAVDAVVNAANESLNHGGGLAGALVKAGGQEIQDESTKYVMRCGHVGTGEIAITGAGRLPCKVIIHAVGPRWAAMDKERCIFNLEKAIRNILDFVTTTRQDLETVAIPALSSGIFQFPLDLCTKIIVNTINSYFRRKQLTSHLKEIHLVSNEDPTVAAFKTASEIILGRNELVSWASQGTSLPFNKLVVNNVTLQIVQGCIELQETDVIVNSAELSGLGAGPVSQSILRQAGDKMEEEFIKKIHQAPQDSQLVLVTKGFKLSCQYVFHVLWPSQSLGSNVETCESLKNAVHKCLEKCFELNLTSISFPALGTGNIGIGKDKVAEIMFAEVLMFSTHRSIKQLTVKFVIFPKDLETYMAFTTEMKKKSSLQHFNNYSVPQGTRGNQENELKAKSPTINLMGSNPEKMAEAQEWIQRLLTHQDPHVIENNHIFFLGRKEHDILSQLQETSKVSILEVLDPGKAILKIKGAQADVIEVIMNIEQMLCEVQEEMARKKEQALWSLSGQWTDQQPNHQSEMKENKFLKSLTLLTEEIQDQKKQFENCGLRVIKVEKIDNVVLMSAFQRKKKMMEERIRGEPASLRLFQQVPQQFCEVISRVGFQRMYSVPCEPKYGAGIYFTKNIRNLASQVKKTSATEKLIYVFEAEVLTGSFCQGHPQNIVPPPLRPGDIDRHDSVVDNVPSPETFVIFSGVQAMPQYLWTCTQNPAQPQDYLSKATMPSPYSYLGKGFSGSPVD
ncbi:protein mono-ADP-ribosyltransferase PARP9 isoform X1 [Saccopteryx bilineata]|uniref:protein mono-ADP-ribosyltransferase PARP9 isoform X1 n=1 Tax=Saccopteryx bilineata TaxID=59482 RepID=UPI00338F3883